MYLYVASEAESLLFAIGSPTGIIVGVSLGSSTATLGVYTVCISSTVFGVTMGSITNLGSGSGAGGMG